MPIRTDIARGLSIQDILGMDITSKSESEARAYVGRLVSAANKRVRRMTASGESSLAHQQMMQTGGAFSVRGKSGESLMAEFGRIKAFLEAPQSTVREVHHTQRVTARQQRTQTKQRTASGITVEGILGRRTQPSAKELRKETTILISAANKRLKRMGEQNRFSIKGKTDAEVRSIYRDVKRFMESPHGGRKKISQMHKRVMDELSKRGVDITPDQYDVFWRSYEELKRQDSSILAREFKYNVLKTLASMMDDGAVNVDDIIGKIQSRLDAIYEEQEALRHGFDGVSEFFDDF